jgi:DNA-directed RNA polymerase subunit alpha
MEHILLPNTIDFLETKNRNTGKVIITPCQQGYGTTLGNALRRVLLSSLPGAAVESVKIGGVQHEFSAITGVKEDVVEIIMNLKQLALKSFSDEPVVISLRKKGKGPVKAGDFEKNADLEIVNPELVIANITDDKTTLEMDITVGKGRGYMPVEEKRDKNLDLGTILIDSLYTPIRDIGYNVEMTRVGDVTDFEKLVLNIETNGTISPKEAVQQATKILMDHFALILDVAGGTTNETLETETVTEKITEETAEEEVKPKKKTTKKKKAE